MNYVASFVSKPVISYSSFVVDGYNAEDALARANEELSRNVPRDWNLLGLTLSRILIPVAKIVIVPNRDGTYTVNLTSEESALRGSLPFEAYNDAEASLVLPSLTPEWYYYNINVGVLRDVAFDSWFSKQLIECNMRVEIGPFSSPYDSPRIDVEMTIPVTVTVDSYVTPSDIPFPTINTGFVTCEFSSSSVISPVQSGSATVVIAPKIEKFQDQKLSVKYEGGQTDSFIFMPSSASEYERVFGMPASIQPISFVSSAKPGYAYPLYFQAVASNDGVFEFDVVIDERFIRKVTIKMNVDVSVLVEIPKDLVSGTHTIKIQGEYNGYVAVTPYPFTFVVE